MKCRRSKTSRGARLRELAAAKPRKVHAPAPASELRIDGLTQGAITYEGTVVVGAHGDVKGGITAAIIVVEGSVQGDLRATQTLRIAATGTVVGDLSSPRVAVARGARIQGRISTRTGRRTNHAAELAEHKVAELLTGG
jgi:cytoskeletal protein CcmA (bactofilin family)